MRNHFFYRKIERKSEGEFVDCGWNLHFDIEVNSKVSEILHSVFNYESGDNYAWPCDNITKEEVDKQWLQGQRSFMFQLGYKEVILYDIKIMTTEQYTSFNEGEKVAKERRVNKIIDIFEYFTGAEIEDRSYRQRMTEQINAALDKGDILCKSML